MIAMPLAEQRSDGDRYPTKRLRCPRVQPGFPRDHPDNTRRPIPGQFGGRPRGAPPFGSSLRPICLDQPSPYLQLRCASAGLRHIGLQPNRFIWVFRCRSGTPATAPPRRSKPSASRRGRRSVRCLALRARHRLDSYGRAAVCLAALLGQRSIGHAGSMRDTLMRGRPGGAICGKPRRHEEDVTCKPRMALLLCPVRALA
jgi:hypothetical protein